MASNYHTTKDGRRVRKGLYYYMNRKKAAGTSREGKGTVSDEDLKKSKRTAKKARSGAWTRKEGKNPSGGLNETGRRSYERENPGSNLQAPQPGGGSRKKSFCARMCGAKKKQTGAEAQRDPNSRINKALRKWRCRC